MWFVFTIATTLLWGLAELFYKKGAHADERYAHLKTSVCVGVVMGAHAVYTILTEDMNYELINLVKYFPVSFCYILSMTLSYFGMRFIEESISDPIENTSGALCALLCVIFLKSEITLVQVGAILLMLVGVLGVGFLENHGATDRSKKLGRKLAIAAFMMPFLYAILDALGSFLDVFFLEMETSPLVSVNEDTIELVANTSYELTFAIFAIILFIYMKIRGVRFEAPRQLDKLVAALCETAGQFTYVFAMSGNGAIAAPIISSVCIVSLILSRIFLREKLTAKQYIFIGLVIIGVVIIGITDV